MAEPPEEPARKPRTPKSEFSRAFDNFVDHDNEDIEGLLAYALYKRTVRDQCRQGVAADGRLRNPPKSEVETYRASARDMIETLLTDYENDVRPDLQRSYYDEQLERWKGEIKAVIRNRTSTAGQIVTNLIAWAITLAISLIVYFAARAMTIDQVITEQAERQLKVQEAAHAADENSAPPAAGE